MNAKEYVIEKESFSDGYSYEGVNEAYQNLFGKTLDKKDFSTNVPYSYKYISNLDCYVELVSPTSYFTTLSYGAKDVKEEDNTEKEETFSLAVEFSTPFSFRAFSRYVN